MYSFDKKISGKDVNWKHFGYWEEVEEEKKCENYESALKIKMQY